MIGVDTVLREMYNAVSLKSSTYVYTEEFNACQNFAFDTGQPKCIVGHILYALGVRMEDCKNGGAVVTTLKELQVNRPELTFTLGAVVLLQAAQSAQDNGSTWGLALNVARGISYTLSTEQSNQVWVHTWA